MLKFAKLAKQTISINFAGALICAPG